MGRPHRIDRDGIVELLEHFQQATVLGATATTADKTMRKRIVMVFGKYRTERRYLESFDWEPVYAGDDIFEAVRAYNLLS